MENKSNCIIIHGCPGKEAEFMTPDKNSYWQHWIQWAQKKINEMGVPTEAPLMPKPWKPDYEKFKKEFEKLEVNENTILIGHSCGCAFLVRWLGETKRKIKQLILVAPWKVIEADRMPGKDYESREVFYGFDIDNTIPERMKNGIVMFTSDTESDLGKQGLEEYKKALGGKIIELPNKGHFIYKHMGTEEFPELLEEIKF